MWMTKWIWTAAPVTFEAISAWHASKCIDQYIGFRYLYFKKLTSQKFRSWWLVNLSLCLQLHHSYHIPTALSNRFNCQAPHVIGLKVQRCRWLPRRYVRCTRFSIPKYWWESPNFFTCHTMSYDVIPIFDGIVIDQVMSSSFLLLSS